MALTSTQIQNAYVAFFNRPADVAGLNYWSSYSGNAADLLNTFAQSSDVNGMLTMAALRAAEFDTAAEVATLFNAFGLTSGQVAAFNNGTNTYVFQENGATDTLVQLTGTLNATSIGLTEVANGILIA